MHFLDVNSDDESTDDDAWGSEERLPDADSDRQYHPFINGMLKFYLLADSVSYHYCELGYRTSMQYIWYSTSFWLNSTATNHSQPGGLVTF